MCGREILQASRQSHNQMLVLVIFETFKCCTSVNKPPAFYPLNLILPNDQVCSPPFLFQPNNEERTMTAALLNDLKARGLINQATADDELIRHLESGSITLYCGFDPTADSLHLGHLVPLLVLTRFQ